MPAQGSEEIEGRILTAIGRARAAGDRIILMRHVSRNLTGQLPADGWNAALRVPVLEAAGDALVVDKHSADGFHDSELAAHLEGVEDLLICGMMSQNSVLFTAMSKHAAAYRVSVVGDLCAAPKSYIHRLALKTLEGVVSVRNADDIYPPAEMAPQVMRTAAPGPALGLGLAAPQP